MKKVIFMILCFISVIFNNMLVAMAYTTSYENRAILDDGSLIEWDENYINKGVVNNASKLLDNVTDVCREFAITKDNELWIVRDSYVLNDENVTEYPIKFMDDVIVVDSLYSHTLILKEDYTLWGMGTNHMGQLGIGTEIGYYDKPVKIMNNVKDIATGWEHSVVLKTDGSVWTFGSNSCGQLGVGEEVKKATAPVKIMEGVKDVFSGCSAGFAITYDNTLLRWGSNYSEIIGTDVICYKPTKYVDNAQAVSSQNGFNLVIKIDNSLWAYGETDDEELIHMFSGEKINTPVKISDNINSLCEPTQMDANRALVLKNNGDLYEFSIIKDNRQNESEYFTFKKILENVQLSTKKSEDTIKMFFDIDEESSQTQSAINAMSKANIINGIGEGYFSPSESITRAEAGAIMLRMCGKGEEECENNFSDVSADDWYYNIAGTCEKYGIINGYADNTFCGDKPLTKAELIAITARVLRTECVSLSEVSSMPDSQEIPDWVRDDVSLVISNNVIAENNIHDMNKEITRAEVTVILYRLYNRI